MGWFGDGFGKENFLKLKVANKCLSHRDVVDKRVAFTVNQWSQVRSSASPEQLSVEPLGASNI